MAKLLMDFIFTSKCFTVSISLCQGREVEPEKLFGLDLWLVKATLCGGFMFNNHLYINLACLSVCLLVSIKRQNG